MHTFISEEDGATAIEYGLIAALISIVIIGGLGVLRLGMIQMYTSIETTVDGAMSTG